MLSQVDADRAASRHSASDSDRLIGTRLGSYMIIEPLGCGGVCTVYRARNLDLGGEFALKVLNSERDLNDVLVQRLRREAAAALRINHPNIVKVIELGTGARGPFLVMELLNGLTLADALRTRGPFSVLEAANVIRQAACGLAAAHRAGFVHRDLKPSNLMVVPQDSGEVVKILDLGIVGLISPDPAEHLTCEGIVVGTPAYMAPEQLQGAPIGAAVDLYALGIVLYEMLKGATPFQGTFKEIIAQHMISRPEPLAAAQGLEQLAYRLLEKSPARRPDNAQAVIEFIDERWPELRPADYTPIPPPTPPSGIERSEHARAVERRAEGDGVDLVRAPAADSPPTDMFEAGLGAPRRAGWGARLAIPMALSVLLTGGAYATQHLWASPRTVEPMATTPQRQGAAEPSLQAFDRKLKQISAALARLADSKQVAGVDLSSLEEWYLDLAKENRPGLSERHARLLAERADVLLGELQQLDPNADLRK